MSPETWQILRPVLDEALDREGVEREAFLAAAFPDDPVLRGELRALVAASATDGGLLDAPTALLDLLPEVEGDEPGVDPLLGATLGAYRVREALGMGGFGTVYRAERSDGAFTQEVAIKVLRPGAGGPESARRFLLERTILARLEHPGIARLLDGGSTPDGRPYLVMELVRGVPATDYAASGKLDVDARLRLFLEIAEAVQFAHQNLVVHRDLKPSNILVTKEGRAKLLDFGIAKLLEDDDAGLTVTGRVLTLTHASPEQVRGEPISTASDVYSLGVLLYELLTGVSPYPSEGASRTTLERAVLETDPPAPSLRRPLDRDLDAIVLKALRKEPHERYPSAAAFASDVSRFLEGLPVEARRGSFGYHAGKFARRHAVRLLVAAVLVVTATGATLFHVRRLDRERLLAQREAEKGFALTDFAFSLASAGPAAVPSAAAQARAQLRSNPELGAAMLREVARLHMARKELPEAELLLDEVAAIQHRIPGLALSEHAETLRTRGKLAVLNGSPEEAARDYEFALELFHKALPPEGGRAVHTLIDLGNAFLGIDRLDAAALAYERAILLQGANDADPQWGRARNNLGIVKMRRREWKEAARLMGEALPNVERSLDETNFELGEFLVTYAEVLREVRDPRAHAFGARGLAIYEKTIPANDPRAVDARSLVAALSR